jgi:hypothetical protein
MDSRFAGFCFAKCLLKPLRGNDGGGFFGFIIPLRRAEQRNQ